MKLDEILGSFSSTIVKEEFKFWVAILRSKQFRFSGLENNLHSTFRTQNDSACSTEVSNTACVLLKFSRLKFRYKSLLNFYQSDSKYIESFMFLIQLPY